MKKIQLFCLFLILANPNSYAQLNNSILSNYKLKISKDNLRLVYVEANMTIQEPYLEMNPWGIPPEIEKGWAKFVDIKSISDEADKPIKYTWNVALKRWDLKTSKNAQL